MKLITLTLGLFLSTFAFGQKTYTPKEVDKHAVYPKECAEKITPENCFARTISSDLADQMSNIVEQFPQGTYVTKVNFTVNEDGSISDIKSVTDDEFGKKSVVAMELVLAKNRLENLKIQPAVLNGKNVKMSYSLPVRLQNL